MTDTLYSTQAQLQEIRAAISTYLRLPFSDYAIPGRIMESVLRFVRGGRVLNTYDFVDVIHGSVGWQVKSTKTNTPVTWKRAKIPDSDNLIGESRKSDEALQRLGDSILAFCNQHVSDSIERYDLETIGYARLIVNVKSKQITYFEREIASRSDPRVFIPKDFEWRWSKPKRTVKKEQLPALHGIEKKTGTKCFAWHGRGENQLHFSGESYWWPTDDQHACTFGFPKEDERLSWDEVFSLLSNKDR